VEPSKARVVVEQTIEDKGPDYGGGGQEQSQRHEAMKDIVSRLANFKIPGTMKPSNPRRQPKSSRIDHHAHGLFRILRRGLLILDVNTPQGVPVEVLVGRGETKALNGRSKSDKVRLLPCPNCGSVLDYDILELAV
jgi:hypothetical protein